MLPPHLRRVQCNDQAMVRHYLLGKVRHGPWVSKHLGELWFRSLDKALGTETACERAEKEQALNILQQTVDTPGWLD